MKEENSTELDKKETQTPVKTPSTTRPKPGSPNGPRNRSKKGRKPRHKRKRQTNPSLKHSTQGRQTATLPELPDNGRRAGATPRSVNCKPDLVRVKERRGAGSQQGQRSNPACTAPGGCTKRSSSECKSRLMKGWPGAMETLYPAQSEGRR